MKRHKTKENNFKYGRMWFYLNEHYSKSIEIEWSLRFNPFNFKLEFDGSERRYLFTFWFIYVFYISFNDIFKKYPKEWNSYTNNKQGGYLDTAERIIGIGQYGWSHISLYFWHDGENSWDKDKCNKIFYKIIWLDKIFIGGYKYHTIEDFENKEVILKLPEHNYKIKVSHRFWEKRYDRFYMKPFNHKGKNYTFNDNEIRYAKAEITERDKIEIKNGYLEPDFNEWEMKYMHMNMNIDQNLNDALIKYKNHILKLRSVVNDDWVPLKYRKKYLRKQKIKNIIN